MKTKANSLFDNCAETWVCSCLFGCFGFAFLCVGGAMLNGKTPDMRVVAALILGISIILEILAIVFGVRSIYLCLSNLDDIRDNTKDISLKLYALDKHICEGLNWFSDNLPILFENSTKKGN